MAPYVRARLRRRHRRHTRLTGRGAAAAAAAAIVLAAAAHSAPGSAARAHRANAGRGRGVVAAAIGYARAQLGRPYVWGGTGPAGDPPSPGFDCSGLVMMAYRAAGIGLPRTSQQQWAAGPQVGTPRRGDLVFFAGADGTPAAPGHVGLVVDPARHRMIEAYATGFPVRVSTFGLPTSPPGDQSPAGFTRPGARVRS